ncbi:DUF3224 domain-containing protein [Streptomyces triticirhizae]|uniref:DUF3224 domain-containing protein n=1 Tax=Streptomyces triticirhizae TaxID=2483353 RepID=UPI001F3B8ABA|nr:DUF3224 domain-containing protein [Streptomyces triticirhizae]
MPSTPIDQAIATHAHQLTGTFSFADWQERALTPEGAEGPRLAQATVTNHFSGGVEAADTVCDYAIVYTHGRAGSFTGLELLTGTVDGRTGTFVLEERGSFTEDGSVTCELTVVPGSGTGELAGLTGAGGFVYRAGTKEVPYTFGYTLPEGD